MKPLGAITKYYSFIDEESKSILDSLMDESSSYYDFAQRLCEVVLENEVSINLAYLAAVQAWWTRREDAMKLIQEKYREVTYLQPWRHLHTTIDTDQAAYHDAVVGAIEEAMACSLEDWMKTELFLLHAFYHWPRYGDVPSLVEPLEQAKEIIEANPSLICFEPLVCCFEAMVKRRENDRNSAILDYQRGLKLAEAHDDSLYKYMNLMGMANVLRQLNIQESLALFEELYQLAQALEVPYFVAEVLNDSALTFETAGEYDLAIACHQEGIKVFGGGDAPSLNLSRIYSSLGDGRLALEWANEAFQYSKNPEFPSLYVFRAWALALSDMLEEAEDNLDIAHPLMMRTGDLGGLASYYRISGIIEFKRGYLLAALDYLEQAQEITKQIARGISQSNVLLDLARVEIAIDSRSKDNTSNASPGAWLSMLEKHARECDYPGIRMYAALLKSDFYQNHNQLEDAHATLTEALDITDSPGVQTLRFKINSRIKEIDQLLQDGEMIS
jgi:tetratricopeptide (TPR) repeat protein